jgi:sec-independent protein translocase protein TatB
MNLGFSEMFFIFLLALIIFGPKRLPEIGRQIGKFMAEFKRATNDFKYQLETEMRQLEIEETLKKEGADLKQVMAPPDGSISKMLNGVAEAREMMSAPGKTFMDILSEPASPPKDPNPKEAATTRPDA